MPAVTALQIVHRCCNSSHVLSTILREFDLLHLLFVEDVDESTVLDLVCLSPRRCLAIFVFGGVLLALGLASCPTL